MVPGDYDITIYKGGTFTAGVEAENESEVETDFETTYDSALLQIRKPYVKGVDSSPLFELSTDNGRIEFDGTSVNLTISAEDTAALDFVSGIYDLELIIDAEDEDSDRVVDKLIRGKVTVMDERSI